MRKFTLLILVLIAVLAVSSTAFAADSDKYQLLINKTYQLEPAYVPSDLVSLSNYISAGSSVTMTRTAAEALKKMVAAAEADGITGIHGQSGYRSYSTQSTLYANKTNYYRNLGYGYESAAKQAGTVVAPPGASEHQSGMAIDITTAAVNYGLVQSFGSTRAGQWLAAHCWEYGFVLRYARDKEDLTGYIYEPWHFRYVGVPHAEYMTKNNLCMEEYLELLRQEKVLGFTAADGTTYATYYSISNDPTALPGELVSASEALSGIGGYVMTTVAPAVLLYDLVGHWSEPEIRPLVELGLIDGYPSGTFRPNRNISRAELIALVCRTADYVMPDLLKETEIDGVDNPFADVKDSDYYYLALLRLYQAGLIPPQMLAQSEAGLSFHAGEKVLRQDAAFVLAPLFGGLKEPEPSGIVFNDLENASEELVQSVQLLADFGVVKGNVSGGFAPQGMITRAEIGSMLMRLVEFYAAAR